MFLESYIENVCYKEMNQIKNKTINDLIIYMHKCDATTIYLTQNGIPIYVFTNSDIFEIFINGIFDQTIEKYIKQNPKEIKYINYKTNILDAYYFMRKYRFKHLPVVDENNKLIGEISFRLISSKIADIVIKDPLTGVYNKKYFDVLIEEYKQIDKPLGIVFVELKNMNIIESFYNLDVVNNIVKLTAEVIKKSLRDVDFVFRIGYQFKIFTFTNLEITDKIVKRIKEKLDNLEYNEIKPSFEIVFSHVPELENNILSALNYCEKKLIERD